MRPSNRNGEGECYQVNSRVRAVHDDRTGKLMELSLDGKPVNRCMAITLSCSKVTIHVMLALTLG